MIGRGQTLERERPYHDRNQNAQDNMSKAKKMKFLTREVITPVATGLFIIMAVSGIALFFHIQQNIFHTAHEWLGLLFVVVAIWHAARHWKSLVNYLGKRPSLAAFAVILAASIAFTGLSASPGGQGGNPRAVIQALGHASLSSAAVALGQTPDQAVALLQAKGMTATPDQRVADIASAAKLQPMNVLGLLVPNQAGPQADPGQARGER